jgi:pyrroloquinoline quinone biosynthesis protein B
MPVIGPAKDAVSVVILGIMQDAGLPHIGCRCHRCALAQADPSRADFAASLAIVDGRRQPPAVWLIDATPDIPRQLYLLADLLTPEPSGSRQAERLRRPDGIFLTHAHMGHTAGLAHLGPEGMAATGLPLYGPAGLMAALHATRLWQPLVDSLILISLNPGQSLQLGPELHITPLAVPHRDELQAGTFAYLIQGPEKELLYLPDIDAWEQWPAAGQFLTAVDFALIDATFFSPAELGGRRPVAHPLVPDTLALWRSQWSAGAADGNRQLILTHLNHTNPALEPDSPERQAVLAAGAAIAQTGQVIVI